MKTKKWLVLGLLLVMAAGASVAIQGCGKQNATTTTTTFYGAGN